MQLTENATRILEKRYFLRDKKDEVVEDWDKLCRRVAKFVASAEKNADLRKEWEEKFYGVINSLEFIPSSPTLFNAGTKSPQLNACFVINVDDSMNSIFKAVHDSAVIYKSGGGVGFYFGHIRPKNSPVNSTGGIASGPLSFMEVFDRTVEVVKQGAKRRGAALGCLPINHPDIEEYIRCKGDKKSFSNFNLSVAVTDEFMSAVERDEVFELKHSASATVRKVKAKQLWNRIIKSTHATGDPGLIFIDTINKFNPVPDDKIYVTNPCGEQPLPSYESCVLGHLNLMKFLNGEDVNYDRLRQVIDIAVRFLDNTIDLNAYPIPEIEVASKRNRRIGLGVMGYADMLISMDMRYDSTTAINFADQLMNFLNKKAFHTSVKLGEEKGNFPNFEQSIFKGKTKHYNKPRTLRNATRTTVAPTGTTSVIAGVSSGIEPNFAFAYDRKSADNVTLDWIHPLYKEAIEKNGGKLTQKQEKVFVTAKDIDADWHLKTQQAFQVHCDSSISKTINLPFRTPIKEIRRIYKKAYDLGLKGITVFRDGCKGKQVLYDRALKCPKCNRYTLEKVEGCDVCRKCGYTACSLR